MNTESAVIEAIRLYYNKEIHGHALAMKFIEHTEWHAPLSLNEVGQFLNDIQTVALPVYEDDAGKKWIEIFTDSVALNESLEASYGQLDAKGNYVSPLKRSDAVISLTTEDANDIRIVKTNTQTGGDPQHFLVFPGRCVFFSSLENLDGIRINPGTRFSISLTSNHFPLLTSAAKIMSVENAIAGLRHAPNENVQQNLETLRHYDNFIFVTHEESGTMYVAPDDKGRKLAAIFTNGDNLALFIEKITASGLGEGAKALSLDGQSLFKELSTMPVDGIVFNCCGPSPAVAFSIAIAGLIAGN